MTNEYDNTLLRDAKHQQYVQHYYSFWVPRQYRVRRQSIDLHSLFCKTEVLELSTGKSANAKLVLNNLNRRLLHSRHWSCSLKHLTTMFLIAALHLNIFGKVFSTLSRRSLCFSFSDHFRSGFSENYFKLEKVSSQNTSSFGTSGACYNWFHPLVPSSSGVVRSCRGNHALTNY